MKISRLISFFSTSIADIRNCVRFADKWWLTCGRLARPITYVLNEAGAVLWSRQIINPHYFILRDILMRTEDGLFQCRGQTSDFGVCSISHEPELRPFFAMQSGTFIDVGANIGKWTIGTARRLGSRGSVVAIEADPDNLHRLRRNIEINGLQNVVTVGAACAGGDGQQRLYRHKWGMGLHRSEQDDRQIPQQGRDKSAYRAAIPIPARKLDSILQELNVTDVRLIKIDVEGAEMDVLLGASRTLEQNEFVRVIIETDDDAPLTFLRNRGFSIAAVGHHNEYLATRLPRGPDESSEPSRSIDDPQLIRIIR